MEPLLWTKFLKDFGEGYRDRSPVTSTHPAIYRRAFAKGLEPETQSTTACHWCG